MALITCKECTAQVSSTALNCPQCGAKLKSPSRGPVGTIIKWLFIAFNVFMLWATIVGLGGASETIDSSATSVERAGATIGTGIGAAFLLFIWVAGAVILGLLTLLTRPKR